jgi:hypothetical protein
MDSELHLMYLPRKAKYHEGICLQAYNFNNTYYMFGLLT